MNTIIESLTDSPAVKQALLAQIAARRTNLEAELQQLADVEAQLSDAPKGRPKGGKRGKRTGPSQRQRILTILSNSKNGMRSGEIVEAIGIDSKVLQTTLSVMRNKHKEVKVTGKSKRDGGDGFVYTITKTGRTNQEATEVKLAAKTAS